MKHLAAALVLVLAITGSDQAADPPVSGAPERMPGLEAAATITIDDEGIAHIRASNPHDLYFLQGWVHARDRFFQMDVNRRIASGTYAELVGPAALESDVTLRTIGLRRGAMRSVAAVSPETRAALEAYADGVNAWLNTHPLPPEYGVLEVRRAAPWSSVDSVVVGKLIAFSLSFELDIDRTVALLSYARAGAVAGFDGNALFHQDLWRSAGFDLNATVPDATPGARAACAVAPDLDLAARRVASGISETTEALARAYLDRVKDIPAFRPILDRDARPGSNLWAVSGSLSATGNALMANDPHLPLTTPSTFYPNGLELNEAPVFGSSFAGVPGVVLGTNSFLAWGTTNNAVDVTDTFQEQVVPDPSSPSGLATLHAGVPEWLIPIPETFRVNRIGNGVPDDLEIVPPGGSIPPATLVMPRRDGGPVIALDPTTGQALSLQFVGLGPTREIEAFLLINRARHLGEFRDALQRFDFGSQNFVYADRTGTIAYFTSGEIPVREDLQAFTVNGLPPWFIRNGQGGNEWLPVAHPQPFHATPFEILPFSELPQVVNPEAGYFVNCNNDPAGVTRDNNPLNDVRPGGGLYYMAYSWEKGYRAARVEQMLAHLRAEGDGKVSLDETRAMQSDVVQRDAQVFLGFLIAAFDRASDPAAIPPLAALAADPRVAEAARRLRAWSGNTPTGIAEGYDGSDFEGARDLPTTSEVQDSVAASIYGIWRSRLIANTVDAVLSAYGDLPRPPDQETLAALRNLLDRFADTHGVGASGIDFFQVPGIPEAADRRDLVLLTSLKEGLDLLASEAFAPAFGGSTAFDDYRWGRLHRIVLAHPLGGPFSTPPALGAFPPPLADLPGIPTDGGYQCVDASHHPVRASHAAEFMFTNGPSRRFVADVGSRAIEAWSIWPGGTSGIVGSPQSFQFLERWLTDEQVRVRLGKDEVRPHAVEVEKYVPAPRRPRVRPESAR